MENKQKIYVAGFLFSAPTDKVVLICKKKPAWQNGQFNGVGGKIEPDEQPIEAMRREFKEETGLVSYIDWKPFCTLGGNGFLVHFFYGVSSLFAEVRSPTDEIVSIYNVDRLPDRCLPNVPWLVEMARSFALNRERCKAFVIDEEYS